MRAKTEYDYDYRTAGNHYLVVMRSTGTHHGILPDQENERTESLVPVISKGYDTIHTYNYGFVIVM